MSRFITNNIEIEAREFITNNDDGSHLDSLAQWITNNNGTANHNGTDLYIKTRAGMMRAQHKDWIVRYVCRDDRRVRTNADIVETVRRLSTEFAVYSPDVFTLLYHKIDNV